MGMKKRLRQGTYRSLNLYIINNFSANPGVTGDCSVPMAMDQLGGVNTDRYYNDGCRIIISTVPGQGGAPGYGAGINAVHEVGHWLGLMHTFEGGCSDPGDHIVDTPAQKVPSFVCKVLDTCPDTPGNDPVHNFMDYTPDSCKTEFTPGQV
jgi:hypothetical protein